MDALGHKAKRVPKTAGTHWDTLAVPVLLRAEEKQLADGMVYDGLNYSFPVIAVKKEILAGAKKTTDKAAWSHAIAAIQLRLAFDHKDKLAVRNALIKLNLLGSPERGKAALKTLKELRKNASPELSAKIERSISALESASEFLERPPKSPSLYLESANLIAAAEFTSHMTQARLVLWLNINRYDGKRISERLEPGLLCPDLETAIYVRGALRDLRACPCCDTPFLPDRPDQVYCSLRCRETHRKRRQRSKEKSNLGGKREKKVR